MSTTKIGRLQFNIKNALKFLLIVFVYSVLWTISQMVMPHSQAYKDMMNAGPNSLSAIFLLIFSIYICFVICYIAANSNWRGKKRIAGIAFVIFMINSFMMQIETFFFGSAFPALTRIDTLSIMISALPPIVAGTMLSIIFFGNKESVEEGVKLPVLMFIPGIAIIGLIYTAVYMLFGYYVFLQFEGARLFYSRIEDAGFIAELLSNDFIIYPFQYVRGVMFSALVLPLFYMLRERGRKKFTISVCLAYLTTPALLIIPNPLFPDIVRWAHFIEMFSSMLLFGIITGLILFIPIKRSITE